jgi:flagellar biosynthesis/type III secretory pathway protein FliH
MSKKIYDDVFRTMCERMPELLIPVLNEVFDTDYTKDDEIIQLRNEHTTKRGSIITDCLIKVRDHAYHLECQSSDDTRMSIRMLEYDFVIALEDADGHGRPYRMKFPESCVIYLRAGNEKTENEEVEIEMPNGEIYKYKAKTINVQQYSKEELFKKKLFMFFPYYILRYEKKMPNARNKEKLDAFLDEFEEISDKLQKALTEEEMTKYYTDMIDLINRVSNHIIKSTKTKERMRDIMGGKVLQLKSERDHAEGKAEGLAEGLAKGLDKGKAEGKTEGREDMLYSLVADKTLSLAIGIQKSGKTREEFISGMKAAGYSLS